MKHTPICHKSVLSQWLKSGVMINGGFQETDEGTPQGGIISPTLCNVALNGMETVIRSAFYYDQGKGKAFKSGTCIKVVRYADDVVVTGGSEEILNKVKSILKEFLKERGLELSPTKTRITDIKDGITFLGFDIQKVKYDPQLNPESKPREMVIRVAASEKGKAKLRMKIAQPLGPRPPVGWPGVEGIVKKGRNILEIIDEINPVLRGWAEHKRVFTNVITDFHEIDNLIWNRIRSIFIAPTAKRPNRKRNYLRVRSKSEYGIWGAGSRAILQLAKVSIKRIKRIKLDLNPYRLEDKAYFNKIKQERIMTEFKKKLIKKYNNNCSVCGESLSNGEIIEYHHIKSVKDGGKTTIRNMMPLHEICHRQITHRSAETSKKIN